MLLTTLELSKAQFKNVHFCNSGIVFPQGNRLTLKGEPGFSYVQTNAVKIISSACTLIVFLRCTHTVTAGLLEKRCVAYKKPGIIKIFISMMPGLYFPTLSDRCHISVFFVAYCFMTTHQLERRSFLHCVSFKHCFGPEASWEVPGPSRWIRCPWRQTA